MGTSALAAPAVSLQSTEPDGAEYLVRVCFLGSGEECERSQTCAHHHLQIELSHLSPGLVGIPSTSLGRTYE
eukprot:1621420-Ditylum_brightwellii.AAC.1